MTPDLNRDVWKAIPPWKLTWQWKIHHLKILKSWGVREHCVPLTWDDSTRKRYSHVFFSYCWWFRNPAAELIWSISHTYQSFICLNWFTFFFNHQQHFFYWTHSPYSEVFSIAILFHGGNDCQSKSGVWFVFPLLSKVFETVSVLGKRNNFDIINLKKSLFFYRFKKSRIFRFKKSHFFGWSSFFACGDLSRYLAKKLWCFFFASKESLAEHSGEHADTWVSFKERKTRKHSSRQLVYVDDWGLYG